MSTRVHCARGSTAVWEGGAYTLDGRSRRRGRRPRSPVAFTRPVRGVNRESADRVGKYPYLYSKFSCCGSRSHSPLGWRILSGRLLPTGPRIGSALGTQMRIGCSNHGTALRSSPPRPGRLHPNLGEDSGVLSTLHVAAPIPCCPCPTWMSRPPSRAWRAFYRWTRENRTDSRASRRIQPSLK